LNTYTCTRPQKTGQRAERASTPSDDKRWMTLRLPSQQEYSARNELRIHGRVAGAERF